MQCRCSSAELVSQSDSLAECILVYCIKCIQCLSQTKVYHIHVKVMFWGCSHDFGSDYAPAFAGAFHSKRLGVPT